MMNAVHSAALPLERSIRKVPMVVTDVKEMNRSRSKVFLDGEFAFVLYKGELRHYHVKTGEELAKEAYDEIQKVVLPKRAKLRAMNLLLKKDYTTAQLRDKLLQGGCPLSAAQEALAYVESFHYTDDLRYAVSYITCHAGDRSRLRMERDLQAKGIEKSVLEKAWLQWEEEGGSLDEDAMIRELLEKRHYNAQTASPTEKRREYAYLMRKGFSSDRSSRAVFGRTDPDGI